MLEHVTYVYTFNLQYASTLVKDLSTGQMVQQPNGVVNHPAWSLGHLVVSANHLGQLVGLESHCRPDGMRRSRAAASRAGGTHRPIPRRTSSWRSSRQSTNATARPWQRWTRPSSANHTPTRVCEVLPYGCDMVIFLMTSHEMNHLGQVAAWRRAMGLGSATGI